MKGEVLRKIDEHIAYSPNEAYPWIDELTRAGVNLSPISWFNGEKERAKVVANQKNAAKIAQYLGGQAIACDQDLGPCLESALASSAQGWIMQVAGPAVEWTDRYSLKSLELWYQPDRTVLDVKRTFVLGARMPVKDPIFVGRTTSAPAIPLFDTEWLVGKVGCDAGSGTGARKISMTVLAPASAAVDGKDRVRTFVELLDADSAHAKVEEHMHLKVRQPAGPSVADQQVPGKVEVCVDLPSPTSANGSYRVVVFNPKTGWAGVGVLPAADVLNYQRKEATAGEK